MFSIESDFFVEEGIEEDPIDRWRRQGNAFRAEIQLMDIADLPQIDFNNVRELWNYEIIAHGLPPAVFVDLSDVKAQLEQDKTPGIGAVDMERIAMMVCEMLGDDATLVDILWNEFDSEITSEICAELGIEQDMYGYPREHAMDLQHPLLAGPFEHVMKLVFDISRLIQCYLVNANLPLISRQSLYTFESSKRGLLLFRLRTHEELAEEFSY